MIVLLLCAAALAGIAVTELTRPLPVAPLLLAALLAGAAVPLTWRTPVWRSVALLACAVSLGAARGSLPDAAVSPLGGAPPGVVATFDRVRESARAGIDRSLPEPQASLAAGVLLGGSGQLDPAFRRDLQRSGLGHLIVIDGFKQVVVAAAVSAVATRLFGAHLALLPSLAAIGGYTLLSGGHPSAVRAALMVGLAQVAAIGGRLADPLTSLGMATLGMALLDPRVLLDVGLQLSVSATLSIVLLWPVLRRWLRLRSLPKLIGEPIGLTLAVTLGCLPVTLSTFEMVSLVSPVAHIVAVPLLPVVLVSAGLLALAAALPLPLLVSAAAWLAWVPTSLLAAAIHVLGSLPGAAVSTGRLPPAAALLLAGVLLGCGVWYMPELAAARRAWSRWRSRHPGARAPAATLAASLVALVLLNALRPGGRASVTPLALGRGEAVFVRGPTGRTTLIVQGNADGRALLDGVADHLAVWEHKLDQVVVLDPGAEKAVGLTLARYPADELTRAPSGVQLQVGAHETLSAASDQGRLRVSVAVADAEPEPRSGPTISAATPGSPD
ncbi:MAG: ComEC/Rec2 family competence protein [Chloroflexi bacterium]|nr:ComEC/Rec2 family competence protein [Chloroflexota bacterium]MBV9597703.1 ComEC/Rec2 family competence protein [Chloroflexota bacterium]